MKKPIYLDYAAATPMDPLVLAAMQPYFTDNFYNPSALYLSAKSVSKDISEARGVIARHFAVRPAEVVFTAGGTEANNLAIRGILSAHPEGNVVVSAIEHESVLKPAHEYDCREAKVLPDGTVDVDALVKLVDDKTVLVSIMYANNEIGTIQPVKEIANRLEELRKRRKNSGNDTPLYLHTDACQAAQFLDLHAARLGVDLMTINGGKIYGPKQSGVLYVRAGVRLNPQVLGGGQEFGVRSGTENVAANVGLAMALDLAQKRRGGEGERLQKLQKLFMAELERAIPNVIINGSRKHRLPNNVHITIPGADNERLIMALDEAGIMAAAGSACSASNDEPSHVLGAVGCTDADARASLRFTMGHQTTENDVRQAINILTKLV